MTDSSATQPSSTGFFSLPLSVQWRKALVSLPRMVPLATLRYTSPEGPHPYILNLPSRGKHEIPVHVFVPPSGSAKSSSEGIPCVVDFHGGGYVLGTCLEQAPFCALLARELGALVLSVDYRMGPVNKFPAAIEDGEDVLGAIMDRSSPGYEILSRSVGKKMKEQELENRKQASGNKDTHHGRSKKSVYEPPPLDTSRIALSGFSSGGNLALNLVLSIAKSPSSSSLVSKDWPSRFQSSSYNTAIPALLYYPSLDCRQLPSERPRPGEQAKPSGFWSDLSDTLMPLYLPRDQAAHPRASPGLADLRDGGLHKQARIQLVLPELDSLSQQSEIWVKKVEDEGRIDDLQVDRYKGMKHGWTQMPDGWVSEEARAARDDAFRKTVEFVKKAWDSK